LWRAPCTESGVRIALKPVTAGTGTTQAASLKQAGASFMDMLAQTANQAVQAPRFAQSNSEEQRNGDSNSCADAQSNGSYSAISQEVTSETTQVPGATRQQTFSAKAAKGDQASIENVAFANTTGIVAERSGPSQGQAKPAQSDDNQNSNSLQSGADQDSLQQLIVTQPFIAPVEIAGNDLLGEQALSRGLPAVETSPEDSKALAEARQPLAGADPSGTTSQQILESASLPGAFANPQALAAEFTLPLNPPESSSSAQASFLVKSSDAIISTNKGSQAKITSSTGAASAPSGGSTAAADSVKSTKQEASPVQHAGQGDGQSSTQAQAASGQSTPAAAKIIDATTQTMGFAAHATSETTPAGHAVSGGAADVPSRAQAGAEPASDQVDGANGAGISDLNAARLIQSMSQSEMRLGMHSAEFGDISVRTSVSAQQVQAQIEVDHNELGNAISAHISSLEAKLGNDFGLHASIEVNQLGSSHHNGQGQSPQQQQNLSSNRALAGEPVQATDTDTQMPSSLLRAADDGRLDIRV
jgi:hypothetical protein